MDPNSYRTRYGLQLVPVLNALGLDAMTAHWEFAYGPAAFQQRAAELNYPMLAINIYDQATKKRYFSPYSVKEIGGLRVGLVGIAPFLVAIGFRPEVNG